MANYYDDQEKFDCDQFEEETLNLFESAIGETGFDIYNWTFTEGKTLKWKGWTIAIPDGFVKIDPKEPGVDGKKRLFELVPVTYKDEELLQNIPIRILYDETC